MCIRGSYTMAPYLLITLSDTLAITKSAAILLISSLGLIRTTGKIQKKFTQKSQPNVEPCGLCMVEIIKPVVKQ